MTVELFAAGSLRDALAEAALAYTARTGVEVRSTFGPSGILRERIEGGEPAGLFASADMGHPIRLAEAGRGGPVRRFARNRLCLMTRPGIRVETADVLDRLLDPELKLGTSTPGSDPSGDYAWALFERAEAARAGARAALQAKALRLVGAKDTMTVPEGRIGYAWHLGCGRADLFLGYRTAALAAARELPGLGITELPPELAVQAEYGLTVLKGGAVAEAEGLAGFIFASEGRRILERWGFGTGDGTAN